MTCAKGLLCAVLNLAIFVDTNKNRWKVSTVGGDFYMVSYQSKLFWEWKLFENWDQFEITNKCCVANLATVNIDARLM